MKALVFDVWGDFAHFKKFYTTSSPLTFSFPPPPTVKGILGAIIGCDRDEYLKVFSRDKCAIAIQILKPVKKIRLGLNHINTKGNFWRPTKKGTHEARTQIPCEFVKDPAYRIYVSHKEEKIFNNLVENIKTHKTVFTISLGLSELLADFKYISTTEFEEVKERETEISSVLPTSLILEGITFKEGYRYFKDRIPIDMDQDRIVRIYEDVLYESKGKKICAKIEKFWKGEDGSCVVFL
ncbi:MAG: type I-B CRISPR-associated protein Cas5b [bacterium]|nr:type I-B CRISPR-associated protein Cas5b [bacterium]